MAYDLVQITTYTLSYINGTGYQVFFATNAYIPVNNSN